MPDHAHLSTPTGPTPAAHAPIKAPPDAVPEEQAERIPNVLPIQRKLSVGAADDPLENEADSMADRVMRMPAPSFIQRKCAHCEEEEKQSIQRQPLTPFQPQQTGAPSIQRDPLPFNPEVVAAQLAGAIIGLGTDEETIYAALAGRTQAQLDQIAAAYRRHTGNDLQADLEGDLNREELLRLALGSPLVARTPSDQASVIAAQLHSAMEGWGTNEEAIYAALSGRSRELQGEINAAYLELTHRCLKSDLRDELTDSEYALALQLMSDSSLTSVAPNPGTITSVTTADIETSAEYLVLTNPSSVWQRINHVTTDEARVMSLLILNHLQSGGTFNWGTDGACFLQATRERLEHSAEAQRRHVDRLQIEISVVTEAESIRLFNEMSRLTFFTEDGSERGIPFRYPADGCYARAYLMEQRLTALGYASRKEFIVSYFPAQGLHVPSDYSVDTAATGQQAATNWGYHVAPTISVQNSLGVVQEMVIDPSLTDRPVTVVEWVRIMGDPAAFRQLTLAEVGNLLAQGRGYGGVGSAYYSTDRDAYYLGNLNSGPNGAQALSYMNDVLGRISTYSQEYEPAHRTAFLIRSQLRTPTVSVADIAASIRALPEAPRRYFAGHFDVLLQELYGRISPADRTTIQNALNGS